MSVMPSAAITMSFPSEQLGTAGAADPRMPIVRAAKSAMFSRRFLSTEALLDHPTLSQGTLRRCRWRSAVMKPLFLLDGQAPPFSPPNLCELLPSGVAGPRHESRGRRLASAGHPSAHGCDSRDAWAKKRG